jgi:hypothetical protein
MREGEAARDGREELVNFVSLVKRGGRRRQNKEVVPDVMQKTEISRRRWGGHENVRKWKRSLILCRSHVSKGNTWHLECINKEMERIMHEAAAAAAS